MWQLNLLQSVEQQLGAVVEGSNCHLKTHCTQLTGLDPTGQSLQDKLNEQRDTLEGGTEARVTHTLQPRDFPEADAGCVPNKCVFVTK